MPSDRALSRLALMVDVQQLLAPAAHSGTARRGRTNLSAFHSASLCPAVMEMPPRALEPRHRELQARRRADARGRRPRTPWKVTQREQRLQPSDPLPGCRGPPGWLQGRGRCRTPRERDGQLRRECLAHDAADTADTDLEGLHGSGGASPTAREDLYRDAGAIGNLKVAGLNAPWTCSTHNDCRARQARSRTGRRFRTHRGRGTSRGSRATEHPGRSPGREARAHLTPAARCQGDRQRRGEPCIAAPRRSWLDERGIAIDTIHDTDDGGIDRRTLRRSASPAALPSITISTFSPTPAPTESIASSGMPRGWSSSVSGCTSSSLAPSSLRCFWVETTVPTTRPSCMGLHPDPRGPLMPTTQTSARRPRPA